MKKDNKTNASLPHQTAHAAANREYKDTVFRMLFSDKRNLLSLFNAVSGCDYNSPDELDIVTLENAIYFGIKNDLAFVLDMSIYLYEHQSTVNPNIPLRDLFYIASEYSSLVKDESLYSSAVRKIPTPHFFVFYNGSEKLDDRTVYKLSDSFLVSVDEPDLELRVTVLNVNAGHNDVLMKQCNTLREYSLYVAKVRSNMKLYKNLDEAVNVSIDECISEGVLTDFLRKNRAEVVMTSLFEYNKEEEELKLRRAEHEAGYMDGLAEGEAKGQLDTFISLVNDGIITPADAAKRLRISEADFIKKISEQTTH